MNKSQANIVINNTFNTNLIGKIANSIQGANGLPKIKKGDSSYKDFEESPIIIESGKLRK